MNTLYDMLNTTTFDTPVYIYKTNCYDQNMPVLKGTVDDARSDSDYTWDYLMCKVELYEVVNNKLLIFVRDEYFNEKLEKQYYYSDKWGKEKDKRPWRYKIEIYKELYEEEDE